jgi:hypothetical protein
MTSEEKESSSNDLFHALKESLERRGVLDPLRAILRAQTIESFEIASKAEEFTYIHPAVKENDNVPLEMKMAEELFLDYLKFRRLDQTLSVFRAETRRNEEETTFTPWDVENELGLTNTPCTHCSRPHGKGSLKVPVIFKLIDKVRDQEKNL